MISAALPSAKIVVGMTWSPNTCTTVVGAMISNKLLANRVAEQAHTKTRTVIERVQLAIKVAQIRQLHSTSAIIDGQREHFLPKQRTMSEPVRSAVQLQRGNVALELLFGSWCCSGCCVYTPQIAT
jgi:hypothetical protein